MDPATIIAFITIGRSVAALIAELTAQNSGREPTDEELAAEVQARWSGRKAAEQRADDSMQRREQSGA